MNTLGIYIYNQTRDAWLQEDERSWGPFSNAAEWLDGQDSYVETLRFARTEEGEVTYTMAVLH